MKGGWTMKIRKAQFSGSWYPGDAAECEREITSFIKSGEEATESDRPLVGGIVPHAGWYFSGSIACNVIHRLQGEKQPDVFVVFGMHLHTRSPNYIMIEGAWETPFGNLEIEEDLAGELTRQFKFSIESANRFTPDNTIELQLPFIKYFFNDVKLVPIGVPPNRESLRIGQAVADYGKSKGLEMRIIGSTDLTHYGTNYGFMPKGTGPEAVDWVKSRNDKKLIDALLAMDPERVIDEGLSNQNACCAGAAASALSAAKHLGAAQAETLAYATSYDKSPGDSFVGYVGVVF